LTIVDMNRDVVSCAKLRDTNQKGKLQELKLW